MKRRQFLSAALIGLTAKAERRIEGSYVNEAFPLGHKLRDRQPFPAATRTVKIPLVIVGGGIAGLSAAWWLDKQAFHEFILLEMDPQPGGNSRWGENAVSRYPWAAHYIPVPKPESVYVRQLLEEFGVLENGQYKEEMLCFSLKERLFIEGRWQEGLEPDSLLTREDRAQFRRFAELIDRYRATGSFTIPMELGSSKGNASELDKLSFESWLAQQGLTSQYLAWYANYACRDDYGALARDTSAWAGIHYFASRPNEEAGPITAPEGNGWIVRRLLEKLARYIQTNAIAYRLERSGTGWLVRTPQTDYRAETVLFAAPTFLAGYIVEGAPKTQSFVYSPWFTANLTLDRLPKTSGVDLAWDNVLFNSPSLGYVDATHMSLRTHFDQGVWTYYWALAEYTPDTARKLLLNRPWTDWKEIILADLGRAHPDIRQCVSRIDMMRIGHAMARPVPGFLTSPERSHWAQATLPALPNLYFANSDLSGFSIFEEAQYRGVTAAQRVLKMGTVAHLL